MVIGESPGPARSEGKAETMYFGLEGLRKFSLEKEKLQRGKRGWGTGVLALDVPRALEGKQGEAEWHYGGKHGIEDQTHLGWLEPYSDVYPLCRLGLVSCHVKALMIPTSRGVCGLNGMYKLLSTVPAHI